MEGAASQRYEAGRGSPGTLALSLLATPLNRQILEDLSRGSRRLSDLRIEIGSPPQTALRIRIKQLSELGVVATKRRSPFPGAREYELTGPPGRELLFVATTLEGWLASAPQEPLGLESEAGRAAVAALASRWTDLVAEGRPGSKCEPTDWLRKGIGPVLAAARWERRHVSQAAAPIRPTDAEVGLLTAMSLLKPGPGLSGSCRLAVEFDGAEGRRQTGVTVEVGGGRVLDCTTQLERSPAGWATGPPEAWLRTAIEADPSRLELGGDRRLIRGLIDGINQALFGPARPMPPQL